MLPKQSLLSFKASGASEEISEDKTQSKLTQAYFFNTEGTPEKKHETIL